MRQYKNEMKIIISDPIYSTEEGDTVGVYNKRIENAIEFKQEVLITTKRGSATFDPRWIKKNCPTIEKVFLRPDEPMKLYKIFIPRKPTKDEEIKKMAENGIFG